MVSVGPSCWTRAQSSRRCGCGELRAGLLQQGKRCSGTACVEQREQGPESKPALLSKFFSRFLSFRPSDSSPAVLLHPSLPPSGPPCLKVRPLHRHLWLLFAPILRDHWCRKLSPSSCRLAASSMRALCIRSAQPRSTHRRMMEPSARGASGPSSRRCPSATTAESGDGARPAPLPLGAVDHAVQTCEHEARCGLQGPQHASVLQTKLNNSRRRRATARRRRRYRVQSRRQRRLQEAAIRTSRFYHQATSNNPPTTPGTFAPSFPASFVDPAPLAQPHLSNPRTRARAAAVVTRRLRPSSILQAAFMPYVSVARRRPFGPLFSAPSAKTKGTQ